MHHMKILHTSDWHLGKRLDDFSRMADQQEVLDEICLLAQQEEVDVVIIAGDLFDTYNPPAEATELFYKTVKQLSDNGRRAVVAIAGNHDSPERIEAPDPLARACGILFAGYPTLQITPYALENGLTLLRSAPGFIELQLPRLSYPIRILLTPYANEIRLKRFLGTTDTETALREAMASSWRELADSYCTPDGVNLLLAHLLFTAPGDVLPEEPEEEKPILYVGGAQAFYTSDIPPQIQYTALGHLHRMQQISGAGGTVAYSGSPLSYSFAEAGQQKYVILIEAEPDSKARIQPLQLHRGRALLRMRAEGVEEALEWLGQHNDALVELTLATETYLTARQRKELLNAHPGIVTLIPEVKGADHDTSARTAEIDLTQPIASLFSDFFTAQKGIAPNDEIMTLFHEILAEEAES